MTDFAKWEENPAIVWAGVLSFKNSDYMKVYFNQGKFTHTDKGIKRFKELSSALSEDDVVGALFYETKQQQVAGFIVIPRNHGFFKAVHSPKLTFAINEEKDVNKERMQKYWVQYR